MTLVMPLADPSYAGVLALGQQVFAVAGDQLGPDLDGGGTVHFARFVIVEHSLVMASSYDGEFADYIEMFIHTMGHIFDLIMAHIADPALTPVAEHPGEFVDWVQRHDHPSIGFYSAYPAYTAQQIRAALALKSDAADALPSVRTLPADMVADVQGLILRGYGHPVARHLVLTVVDAEKARAILARLAGPVTADEPQFPRITGGTDWGAKQPPTCSAIAITATGLLALGVPAASMESFPTEFLAGAVDRAAHVGDIGSNAPEFWDADLRNASLVHAVFSLYARDAATRDSATAALETALAGAFRVVANYDAAVFPEHPDRVHFGYCDNISQPIIAGDPVACPPDGQPLAAAGEFVLGYESQYSSPTQTSALEVPTPIELGRNGSFTALRILEQDVVAFEEFVDRAGTATGKGPGWVAAKIVGRWRNGIPLVLSPDTADPQPPIPDDALNNYNYADMDPAGLRCPVGAHMRRANPRDQPMVPIGDGHARRVMRRGMPYGPEWSPGDAPDRVPRGLIGHFIGASLLLQFETVMGEWLNGGLTEPTITGTNDALLGVADTIARCPIPSQRADGTVDPDGIVLTGFPQFVRTRGCVYGFLPSLTALRWLATIT